MKVKVMKFALNLGLACLCLVLLHHPARANERSELDNLFSTTLNLIKLLVEQGALNKDKADALTRDVEKQVAQSRAASKPEDSKTVRVPYVPEVVRNEIREQIKQEVLSQAKSERWGEPGALPEWISRIKWEGDFRLRLARDLFPSDNTPLVAYPADASGNSTINLPSTTENRDRLRVRARLALQAQVADNVIAGVRVATGNANSINPVSTTQTLGSSFNNFSIVMDRAYLRLDPAEWVTIQAGRFSSPWLSTNLVWHDELGFDGLAATLKPRFGESSSGFFTAGAFPVQEFSSNASDKWLYGAQAGAIWTGGRNTAKAGLAFYEFKKVEGRPAVTGTFGTPGYGSSAPQFRQRGNTLIDISDAAAAANSRPLFGLASKFRLLNLTGTWTNTSFDPVNITFAADYVRNIGYDRSEIANRAGIALANVPDKKTKGYQGQLTVGMAQIRRARDWQVFGGYRHLERDAVMDAFTDSDFHAGGTDTKGYFLGAGFGIARNTWIGLRWMSSDAISGPPLGIDTLFVDLNARF